MAVFRTAFLDRDAEVQQRLADFGFTPDQFIAIARTARSWANDASPLMPLNAPGTLAYIYGVLELRQQLVGGEWQVDRTSGIEAVVNPKLGMRIGYQNVDRACDPLLAPAPRSAKGVGAENICGPTLFEHAGVEPGPLTGVLEDGIPTYYVMVGEDGSVELSHPVIKNGSYARFYERILIQSPIKDWDQAGEPDTAPAEEIEIPVTFKNEP